MSVVEQAGAKIQSWDEARNAQRLACTELFRRLVKNLDAAIVIWQTFLERNPASRDRFSAVIDLGSEPSKHLHGLHLDSKECAAELTQLTGIVFRDSLGMHESIDVVMPYASLGNDEVLADRARAAIEVMTGRRAALHRTGEAL